MHYMVVERFKDNDPGPVYQRFRERGRLLPEGLEYVASWVDQDRTRCFQLMETGDPRLIDEWISRWQDLVDFEVHPVETSAEAAGAVLGDVLAPGEKVLGAGTPTSRLRQLETLLARFSLATLLLYVPVETWISRDDLTSPGYIVDVIAMLLLLTSGIYSLRCRPRIAIAPLCGAWGWCACLAWRTYFMRVISRERGLGIYPADSQWQEEYLFWVLVVALLAFALSLVLAWRTLRLPAPESEQVMP